MHVQSLFAVHALALDLMLGKRMLNLSLDLSMESPAHSNTFSA